MVMEAKRIILNFEEQVYCDESRVWYILDYQVTPIIRDVIADVVKNLKCREGWNLYVNDVLAPDWTLSSVIYSENDIVKLIRTKNPIPLNKDSNGPTQPCKQDIPVRDTQLVEAKVVNESKATTETLTNEQKPLKINNNFKRKYFDTTPTHKDRYTNRSKVYVSPVLPKNVPVANALKTAVKETLTYNSPIQSNVERSSNCKTVTDSFHKARIFLDKVTTILNRNSTNPQVDSDCDSSMASASSENDSDKRVVKKLKMDPKSNLSNSLSLPAATGKILIKPAPSSSSDSESEPETNGNQPLNDKKESSSSDSEDDTQNQSQSILKTKPSFPPKKESSDDSTEEESDEESDEENNKEENVIEKNIQPKKMDSDSSSESDSDNEDNKEENIIEKNIQPKKMEGDSSSENDSDFDKRIKTIASKICAIKKDSDDDESSEWSEEDTKSTFTTKGDSKPFSEVVEQKSVIKDYNNCANLEGTPRVADKLAFKMLDLNESYCPVISEYKEGVITEYNCLSQRIVVKLLPQFQNAMQKSGKFEMDDSYTSDVI